LHFTPNNKQIYKFSGDKNGAVASDSPTNEAERLIHQAVRLAFAKGKSSE
jgi:hypothetical protein